jgi:hypothetical protein
MKILVITEKPFALAAVTQIRQAAELTFEMMLSNARMGFGGKTGNEKFRVNN